MPKENSKIDEVSKNILNKLNNFKYVDGMDSIQNMEFISTSIKQISNVLTTFISSIASISLIVGGIGIMNVMYMTVSERTREIVIRRALGATKKTIVFQFIVESVVFLYC